MKLLLFTFLLFSTNNPSSITSLIPLAVGNQWVYHSSYYNEFNLLEEEFEYEESIVSDTLIQSNQWFRFQDGSRMAKNSLGIFRGDYSASAGEGLFLKKTEHQFASWEMDRSQMKLMETRVNIKVPAGNFICKKFTETVWVHGFLLTEEYFVSEDVGIVKIITYTENERFVDELIAYSLN